MAEPTTQPKIQGELTGDNEQLTIGEEVGQEGQTLPIEASNEETADHIDKQPLGKPIADTTTPAPTQQPTLSADDKTKLKEVANGKIAQKLAKKQFETVQAAINKEKPNDASTGHMWIEELEIQAKGKQVA